MGTSDDCTRDHMIANTERQHPIRYRDMLCQPSVASTSCHYPTKCGHYRLGSTIGKGNFAVVRLAVHDLANVKVG
jgi:hypothetical protein